MAVGAGVGAGVAARVGVGATGVAVADRREPPPTARGEDAALGVAEDVSAHAAPDNAETRQTAQTAVVGPRFMPPGPLRWKNPTFTDCGQ